ncbi:MAG: hypothetical protein E5X53_28340 [Mesorhizobium sp.]|uniref:hypothetical protein n=1 Tax=Mesorhizobium sp. TaxID=1871066 RepID=UPI001205710A|nr:hypothetical protein [Mesorhizobium sp.]TIP70328.1 MAG: hypothetical protein E5X55_27810 [Mesorhizobium sp.]TIQ06725.1 MAG: hypothetical protein E5X57_24030 [Mesorhizobium sp.]TIR48634.1 MAG: hypothetical protein E5X53_28340 [Mesorhizobium sp.]TJV94677.1 MAG: hypothetical protein E5X52_27795 [Mesorhizobium sp.]
MTLTSLIRRTIVQWSNWRQHRETRRAMPALRELDRLEALYRKQHRRGSAKIVRAKRDLMLAALAAKRRS